MKRLLKIAATLFSIAVLAFGAVLAMQYLGLGTAPNDPAKAMLLESAQVKGFFVATGTEGEFPSGAGLSSQELRQELDAIIDFAANNSFNAIFFQVRTGGEVMYRSKYFPKSSLLAGKGGWLGWLDSFDALDYLCKQAAKSGLEVYATLDPYALGSQQDTLSTKWPAAKQETLLENGQRYLNPLSSDVAAMLASAAGELADKYSVAGVLYTGLDQQPVLYNQQGYLTALGQLLANSSAKAGFSEGHAALGIVAEGVGEVLTPGQVADWVQAGSLNLVLPRMSSTVGETYREELTQWCSSVVRDGVRIFTANPAYVLSRSKSRMPFESPDELAYQLFANSLYPAVSGAVLESYADLLYDPDATEYLMSYTWDSPNPLPEISLSFSQSLATTPQNAITVTSDMRNYYITGTSDPVQPLLLDGKELQRTTTNGAFGVLVPLSQGVNTFVFTQPGQETTVRITRPAPSAAPAKISQIVASSLFPAYGYPVEQGSVLTVRCTGPADGKITAQLAGQTVTLTQTGKAAAGTPATYTGEITLPQTYPQDEVTEVGTVGYTLNYAGTTTTYKSQGSIFVKGKNAVLALETTQPMTGFYEDEKTIYNFLTDVKAGARDTITQVGSTRYLTGSGGYVDFKSTKILSGKVDISNIISEMSLSDEGRAEIFRMQGTNTPAYRFTQLEDGLELTLYNSRLAISDLGYLQSNIFERVQARQEEQALVLYFRFLPGQKLWGYDISFSGNDILFYAKRPPKLSDLYARPLDGVSIMLDPGHGGDDPGALGVGGVTGPVEAKMNLAVAYMTKHRLEQLGATVTLTRVDDSTLALLDRPMLAAQQRPDFFVSIHHNSVVLSRDANEVTGTQVYYQHPTSAEFATALAASLASRIDRNVEAPYPETAYYVTRQTGNPALLLEVAYICNPAEHEAATDSFDIFKTACGIAQSLVVAIEQNQAALQQPIQERE